MNIILAIGSIAVLGFGFASASYAQSETPAVSPAAILGVQERSLSTPPKRNLAQNPTGQAPTPTAQDEGLVLYRLDSKTRVVIGPAQTSAPTGVGFGDSVPGDNRVRLLHDLEP